MSLHPTTWCSDETWLLTLSVRSPHVTLNSQLKRGKRKIRKWGDGRLRIKECSTKANIGTPCRSVRRNFNLNFITVSYIPLLYCSCLVFESISMYANLREMREPLSTYGRINALGKKYIYFYASLKTSEVHKLQYSNFHLSFLLTRLLLVKQHLIIIIIIIYIILYSTVQYPQECRPEFQTDLIFMQPNDCWLGAGCEVLIASRYTL